MRVIDTVRGPCHYYYYYYYYYYVYYYYHTTATSTTTTTTTTTAQNWGSIGTIRKKYLIRAKTHQLQIAYA